MCTNNYYIHSEILRVQNCFLLTQLLFSLCFGSLVQDKELDTLFGKKKKKRQIYCSCIIYCKSQWKRYGLFPYFRYGKLMLDFPLRLSGQLMSFHHRFSLEALPSHQR